MPDLTPAIAYARHSDRKQGESVDQQIAEYRKYSSLNGLRLIEPVFEDRARSGRKDVGRDGLEAMMKYLARRPRPVKIVLLWSSARLARNVDDSAFYKSSIRRMGYQIVYVGEVALNISDPALRHVMESYSESTDHSYSIKLAQDVKRGMLSHASQGHVISRAPRGYVLADGKLAIDPLWESAVRKAWEMRAAGFPLTAIHDATHLFAGEHGYTRFFRRKTYLGVFTFAGIEFPDFAPPLCTPEQWARVQEINSRRAEHPRRVNSSYLLSGRVYCGLCGTRMKGATQSQTRQYQYYKCAANSFHPDACGKTAWRRDALDALVIAQASAEFTPENIAPLYVSWLAGQGTAQDTRARELSETSAKLSAANNAIANLLKAIEAGSPPAALVTQLAARESEREALAAKLAELPAPLPVPIEIDIPEFCAEIVRRLASTDAAEQRLVLRAVVERVDATRELVKVKVRPFPV